MKEQGKHKKIFLRTMPPGPFVNSVRLRTQKYGSLDLMCTPEMCTRFCIVIKALGVCAVTLLILSFVPVESVHHHHHYISAQAHVPMVLDLYRDATFAQLGVPERWQYAQELHSSGCMCHAHDGALRNFSRDVSVVLCPVEDTSGKYTFEFNPDDNVTCELVDGFGAGSFALFSTIPLPPLPPAPPPSPPPTPFCSTRRRLMQGGKSCRKPPVPNDVMEKKVLELGGAEALDGLQQVIAADDAQLPPPWTGGPPIYAPPEPGKRDGRWLEGVALTGDQHVKPDAHAAPLVKWLMQLGEGTLDKCKAVLFAMLKRLPGTTTPLQAIQATSKLLNFDVRLHKALMLVYARYTGPESVRSNAKLNGGHAMHKQTHMSGGITMYREHLGDNGQYFKYLPRGVGRGGITDKEAASMSLLVAAVTVPFDISVLKDYCRNDRRSQTRAILWSSLQAVLRGTPSKLQLASRWLFREKEGADIEIYRRHEREKPGIKFWRLLHFGDAPGVFFSAGAFYYPLHALSTLHFATATTLHVRYEQQIREADMQRINQIAIDDPRLPDDFFNEFVRFNNLVPTEARLRKMKLLGGDEQGVIPAWRTYGIENAARSAETRERKRKEGGNDAAGPSKARVTG